MTQKRWIDLLGMQTINTSVRGSQIVRWTEPDKFKVLWSFGTEDEARAAHAEWCRQVEAYAASRRGGVA